MARTWAKVHADMAQHPKWLDLSWPGRAAWVTLFAQGIPTEARYKSRAHVTRLLTRDGCEPTVAEQAVDELEAAGLLDITEAGVALHDWAEWQATYRGPSDEPEAAAERKRAQRERDRRAAEEAAAAQGHDESRPVTSGHDRGDKRRGEESPHGRAREEVTTGHEVSRHAGLPHITEPIRVVLEEVTGRGILQAGDRQLTELDGLAERHAEAEVIEALRTARAAVEGHATARQVVWGAVKVLEPMLDGKALSKAAAAREERAARQRATEAAERQRREQRELEERAKASTFRLPAFEEVVRGGAPAKVGDVLKAVATTGCPACDACKAGAHDLEGKALKHLDHPACEEHDAAAGPVARRGPADDDRGRPVQGPRPEPARGGAR